MKKWLLFFFCFTLFIFVIFLTYLYTYRAEFASTYLSRSFKVQAKIEKINITSDAIILKNVTLFNPHGYLEKKAFHAKRIVLHMSMNELIACFFTFRDTKISQISVYSPLFHIVTLYESSDESNWSVMLASAQERDTYFPGMRKFLVDRVLLQNVGATFLPDVTGSKTIPLLPIDLIKIADPALQNRAHTGLYILMTVAKTALSEIAKKNNKRLTIQLHNYPQIA